MKQPTVTEMQRRLANDPAGLPVGDEVTLGIGYLRLLDKVFARPTVLDDAGHTTTPIVSDHQRCRFAVAAYNAGEGRVAAAQRRARGEGGDPQRFEDVRPFLPGITQRYVRRVVEVAAALRTGGDPVRAATVP